ncbi:MAG: hypothetical protein WCX46_02370 [Candidatus Paceibacterota bacterium]
MELISKRMTKIANLETEKITTKDSIKSYDEAIARDTKDIARATYAKSKIEDANPDAEDLRKEQDEIIKSLNESIAETKENKISAQKDINDTIVELDKEIDEQKKGIKKIEDGETKVSLEELNQLTDVLMLDITKAAANASLKDITASPTVVA